jgi:MbtH protein
MQAPRGMGDMANPFEDESGTYRVLVNDQGQHSLWPTFLPIPDGWSVAGPEGDHQSCLAWIDANWTDMRPQSLIDQVNAKGDRSVNPPFED